MKPKQTLRLRSGIWVWLFVFIDAIRDNSRGNRDVCDGEDEWLIGKGAGFLVPQDFESSAGAGKGKLEI
ncbi:hypothetical protein [Aequorivita viscosa]|uniref:hypothetical protein n=1 Tax=Aequorivita viscosa TaxID=797419 RepID=UPI00115FE569|nr:hypothetical protein [Aequorivita viscosa]